MKMCKHITVIILSTLLLTACDKDNLTEFLNIAEAGFILPANESEPGDDTFSSFPFGENITLYYGMGERQNFQEGVIAGDTILFNYPVLLSRDYPGRLQAKYVRKRITPPRIYSGPEILADTLYVDSDDPATIDIAYRENRYLIQLLFKHSNALVDLTLLENDRNITGKIRKVNITMVNGDGQQRECSGTGCRVIVPAGYTPTEALIILNDSVQVPVKKITDLVFERNKRYPVEIKFSPDSTQLIVENTFKVEDWN